MSQSHQPTNGPPKGNDWGERTKQATGNVDTAPGYWETDAYEMRRKYGISRFEFDPTESYQVWPDVMIHETKPALTDSARGTNALIEGKKGSGKTTLALDLSCQQMEVNDERVIWRADARRSGWLPFRHWTTLWLPSSADHDAMWMLEGDEGDGDDKVLEPIEDVEEIVREVRYYDDPVDLCEKFASTPKGSFHVVYPDPAFTGCTEYTRESDTFDTVVEFTPKWEAGPEQSPTPTTYWWFIFFVARIEYGPYVYTSLIFDELADFAPEGASNEGTATATLIEALRSVLGESRRRFLSIFAFCQEEVDLHHKARRRFDWRIAMPGRPNPCQTNNYSLVGFRGIPMEYDTMGKRNPGTGLVFNENAFNWFPWSDVRDPELESEQGGRWLKIVATPPASATVDVAEAVEYDSQIMTLERRGEAAYLVVNDPGEGYIDVATGAVGEDLAAPIDGLELDLLHSEGGGWELQLVDQTNDSRSTVGRLSWLADRAETEVGK